VDPSAQPRLYTDLAAWWPLFSGPAEYEEEAREVLAILLGATQAQPHTMLELGSGGGSLSSHLKPHFTLTLSDRSAEMLAVSRALNPECEHVHGDMRSLELGRQFDRVMIHDAVMYLTDPASVQRAIATAARHCRPGGAVVILPDCVTETFEPGTEHGGDDAPDGRGLRWLQWSYDPDPADYSFVSAYSFLFRERNGALHGELDHHLIGLFPRGAWLEWMREAGLLTRVQRDPWRNDVFVGIKPG
jgi:SAM-dependent methyltransferase